MSTKMGGFRPDPEVKRRWFNAGWFVTFNLLTTALLTPLTAEYQFVWHGAQSLITLSIREWVEALAIAFMFSLSAYYMIGDSWVHFCTRKNLRERRRKD